MVDDPKEAGDPAPVKKEAGDPAPVKKDYLSIRWPNLYLPGVSEFGDKVKFRNGRYSTTNPKIQAGIESHPHFGSMILLVGTPRTGGVDPAFAAARDAGLTPEQVEAAARKGKIIRGPLGTGNVLR